MTTSKFLADFRPSGPWVLTSIAVDKKSISTVTFSKNEKKRMQAWLAKQTEAKRNLYHSVNSTLSQMDKKAERADISTVDWLHVDIDPGPGFDLDDEQKRILAIVQQHKGLPAPTCIVFSGGGYNVYWKLAEPIPINGDITKADDAARYNLQIELMLGADSCHNVDRILRLPGTTNWPNEKKRKKGQVPALAEVVLWKPERVYPLTDFTKAPMVQDSVQATSVTDLPVEVSGNVRRIQDLDKELPDGVAQRAQVVIVQGHDPDQPLKGDNSRSAWLFYVVCELVRHETPDDDIYSIITDPDFAISASVLDKGNSATVDRYAKKQIRSAKEFDIEPALAELNGKYALVESVGGKCRVAREGFDPSLAHHDIEFHLIDGFRTVHSNRTVSHMVPDGNGGTVMKFEELGKWWLKHPNRRTYKGVIFYPNHTFPDMLNLWRGFACDAIPGDCSLFLDHIRDNLCKGNTDHYDFMVGWMAHAVQFPHLPGESAIVMRGRMGTGKGVFAHTFGGLWGGHYKHITNPKHLLGNFNSQLRDAGLVFADEAFNTQSKLHESALKALITEPRLMVELKGVDVVSMRNCTHNILAGNEDWLVPVRLGDRRFFIVEVDDAHRCDNDYFAAMVKQMEDGGRPALLHHLLSYDLTGFDVRNPPKTGELQRQQDHSMTDLEAFWYDRLEDGRILPDEGVWQTEVLKDRLVDAFMDETKTHMSVNQAKVCLGKFLIALPGLVRKRLRRQTIEWFTVRNVRRKTVNPWIWCFPTLAECRAHWDKEYGARDWPEIEPDDEPQVDAPQSF